MKSLLLYLFVMTLLFSCDDRRFYSVDSLRVVEVPENADSLLCSGVITNTAGIRNVLSAGKYLIVVQNCGDTIFKIIDVKCDSVIAGFGQVGRASNEFSQVPCFYYISSDEEGKDLLYVQELDRTKVIDLEKSIKESKCVVRRTILENVSPITHACLHINQNEKMVDKAVAFSDARELTMERPAYTHYKNRTEEKVWNIYPALVDVDNPNLLKLLYIDRLFVKKDGTKALSMMKFIDNVTIFDLHTGKTLGLVDSHSYGFDFLNEEITSDNYLEKLKIYNMAACVNDDYILMLKDCRLYKDMVASTDDAYSSRISVFDWDGAFLSSFVVDRSLWDIAYVESANALYGVSLNLDKIYRYELKLK